MRTVAPATDAPASDTPPKKDAAPADRKKKRAEARRRGKKKSARTSETSSSDADPSDRKISLDEDFLVEGKLEKPNAFYILRRSQAGYDWARLDAKFLPLVLESVQDPLF